MWKIIKSGQTCVAPDYLFIQNEVRVDFLKLIVKEFKLQYGENAKESIDYPRIISKKEINRLSKYLENRYILRWKL